MTDFADKTNCFIIKKNPWVNTNDENDDMSWLGGFYLGGKITSKNYSAQVHYENGRYDL